MRKHYHGENSITFAIFTCFDNDSLLRLLKEHVDWYNVEKFKSTRIEAIHFFPCFGKRYGYGEPDVIIITDKYNIFVEVEMVNLSIIRAKHFRKQLKNFIILSHELEKSSRKILRLGENFEGEDGRAFGGNKKHRRLYKDLQKEKGKSAFLILSNSEVDINKLIHKLNDAEFKKEKIGYVSFKKIIDMKNINKTPNINYVTIINENFEE